MDKSTSSPLKSASPRSINKIRSEKPPSLLGSRLALAQLSRYAGHLDRDACAGKLTRGCRRAETPEIEGGMASSTTSSPKRRCSKRYVTEPIYVVCPVNDIPVQPSAQTCRRRNGRRRKHSQWCRRRRVLNRAVGLRIRRGIGNPLRCGGHSPQLGRTAVVARARSARS